MSLTPNTVKYGLKIRSTTGVETSIYSGSNADLSTLATITGQTTLGSLFLRDDGTILKKNTDTDNISDWVELAAGTATLQGAYDNSVPNPEILTSDTNGGLTLRRGTTGGDTDTVIEVQNNAGTTNFTIAGDGHIDSEIRQRLINTASPTAITKLDGTLLFDTTSTAITIDLPSASIGKVKIPYKDIGANAYVNNITINTDGADTVVTSVTGLSSATININGDSGYFLSNGIDTWYLFGAYQNLT